MSLTWNRYEFIKSNKYPLLITLIFFSCTFYVSFFVDNPALSGDALYYFFTGKQILDGEGENVKVLLAPIGGPIIFATLDNFFNDPYITIKIISLLSGSVIVFLSFFIIKNIFGFKIALLGQLFIAINPKMHFQSIIPLNEILPVALIFASFYYITKKELLPYHIIFAALFLGISFMIRYQALLVCIGIVIFLLVRDRKIRKNVFQSFLFVGIFLITISPLILYNYSNFGTFLDNDPAVGMFDRNHFQTPEWIEEASKNLGSSSIQDIIFFDFNLFMKNYFYNLFYHTPDRIFNFSSTIDNISPTPPIPFLGAIIILIGLIYSFKPTFDKKTLFIVGTVSAITTTIILLVGDIQTHFFAIIILPIISLGILSIKKIEKQFLPLLTSAFCFFIMISIVPITRGEHLFSIWLVFPILTSVFFIKVIPQIFDTKNKFSNYQKRKLIKIIAILIIIILLVNIGFSYKLFRMIEYNDKTYEGIPEEIKKIFIEKKSVRLVDNLSLEMKEVLGKQPNIQSSYVMATGLSPVYYADSKLIFAEFTEGNENESLESYITRNNWSGFEYYLSNLNSFPTDRNDIFHPKPDYLLFIPLPELEIPPNLKILEDPTSPLIPSNFELIFQSEKTGMVIYKINHNP